MRSSKYLVLLAIVCFTGLARAHKSARDFVAAHNAARAEVGVGPIAWSHDVAAYALNYSKQRSETCDLVHSEGPFGENLAMASYNLSALEAVKMWVDEKSSYDYNSNSCLGNEQCLHYTQVVWRDTTHVGCARVPCKNGWWFVSCNYDPPGNYIGDRPY